MGRPTAVNGSGYGGITSYVNGISYRAFGMKQISYANGKTSVNAEGMKQQVSYQINVAYDKDLFERPPTIEAGPEAWKPKLKQ